MKKLSITLLLIMLAGCSSWWTSDGDDCRVYPEITWMQDCEYSISVHTIPCAEAVDGYIFKWGDFRERFIPAVNGIAEFKQDFKAPGTYHIELTAIDEHGNKVAKYSNAHEFDCGGGA